jgi:acetyl esterase/lipase
MKKFTLPAILAIIFVCLAKAQSHNQADRQVESDIVYGMYSGLALLMDAYYPRTHNGYGIVFIAGSGWHAPLAYDAEPLKSSPQIPMYVPPLLHAGYTVFVPNHRAAPRFRYPAAVEDVQRAVRFIRHNATHYGIRSDRIGAAGLSSGGYLVDMLGVLPGRGDAEDPDPVNRESAKVQAVVSGAGPSDFLSTQYEPMASDFLGLTPYGGMDLLPPTSIEYKTCRTASPLYSVSKEAAPFLLIHGDADKVVPIKNSELMEKALREAGVPVKLLRISGGGHGTDFPGAINPPDYLGELIRWFDQYLKQP